MPPTICLNMIVKNESKIIERLFESIETIFDTYCICDTGSSDSTISIITKWMKRNGKKGVVVEEPFKNFGYNRTFAINAAKNNEQAKADYILFLDADMKLVIGPSFKKEMLTADVYQILQKNPVISYYNVRLARMHLPISCVGVTHEFYSIPGGNVVKMESDLLSINDIGDGGSKGDKTDRDIRLLTAGIADPDTPGGVKSRYYFYLANSYFDKRDFDTAIKNYNLRIECAGWPEETWYAMYRLAMSYRMKGEEEKCIAAYLNAYNFRPERAESLYELVNIYRVKGKNATAYAFYKLAKAIPYPKDDVLFVNHAVYEHALDYELSVIGYYVGVKHLDLLISKLLHVMQYSHDNLLSNLKFVVEKRKLQTRDKSEISQSRLWKYELPFISNEKTGEKYRIQFTNFLLFKPLDLGVQDENQVVWLCKLAEVFYTFLVVNLKTNSVSYSKLFLLDDEKIQPMYKLDNIELIKMKASIVSV